MTDIQTPQDVTRHRRRLFLLRHGAVDYKPAIRGEIPADDVPLTEEGQTQAKSIGVDLQHMRFDLVAHSGLERTIQTAEWTTGLDRAVMHTEPRIREIHLGPLAGLGLGEKLEMLAWRFADASMPDARYTDGEKFSDCQARVVAGFDTLLALNWDTALIVAHEVVNRIILSHWAGAGLHGLGAFDQRFCAVNVIDIDRRTHQKVFRTLNAAPGHFSPDESRLIAMEQLTFALDRKVST